MPVTLYKRQKQIYDFISQYIQKFGCSPTLQQIADAINVHSLATIHEHLQAMVKKGVIRKYEGTIRGIELIDKKMGELTKGIEVPILGYIAAGAPIEPFTDPNATLQVSASMLSGGKSSFVLQVKGESMIEDGILPDDYVVVEQQEVANNGDIVVALLDNGFATLKRFYKEASRIRLEPANAKMSPIFATRVRIQGKVVGVIRKYQV
ncbi:repressor LexA [Candidatus Shapirobacteria bacterium CG08_land_8_20_14_0_20_39_18]|uniref:LexA repressor n=1 Tax=Candidatus Shapirobacteria bacterium CG08_land_8_20_14_0_20_39_18 TaxID=1974883 RepID=A0A2M6XD00_9BACT|nr:MAG: repressor LexA [Candidatus Shapirobacteria bacterium CG08_land_8_20_14_0_20_39_18]PIY65275.1 MAG: repressor LexA [Candidatus Shapirobacteria bacterium CG_4_10_14_0_8_um_filter_39_15]